MVMKFKENGGVSAADLARGTIQYPGDDIPNTGDNVFRPESVVERERYMAMAKQYGWPDFEDEAAENVGGFLCREEAPDRDRDDNDRG